MRTSLPSAAIREGLKDDPVARARINPFGPKRNNHHRPQRRAFSPSLRGHACRCRRSRCANHVSLFQQSSDARYHSEKIKGQTSLPRSFDKKAWAWSSHLQAPRGANGTGGTGPVALSKKILYQREPIVHPSLIAVRSLLQSKHLWRCWEGSKMGTIVTFAAKPGNRASTAISLLRDFVQSELPIINSAIEGGTAGPHELVSRLRPILAAVREEAKAAMPLERQPARRLLQLLGFAISSVERHFQAAGEEPGTGKGLLGPLDEFLIRLAHFGKHPPRDSDTTYWYLNDPCTFTFTGDLQEAHFNRIVNLQRRVQSAACHLLRPICAGILPVSSPDAVLSMSRAAEGLEQLLEGYRSFTEPVNGGYRFSPDFFMRRMRTYLVGYPIGGRLWSGPNAANLAANMSLDYLTGVTAPEYAEVVKSRWCYLVKEDQDELEADMRSVSLSERVVQAAGLNFGLVSDSTPEDLARHISGQPIEIDNMLNAFRDIMSPLTQATGIHFRLIKDYLIRNAEKLSPEEYDALPIKPDKGTGEMAHAQTRRIMEMRRKHPIVSKLLAAVRINNTQNQNQRVLIHIGGDQCPRNTR